MDIPWASAAVEQFGGADDDHDVHRGRAVLEDIVDAIRSLPESAQLTELREVPGSAGGFGSGAHRAAR